MVRSHQNTLLATSAVSTGSKRIGSLFGVNLDKNLRLALWTSIAIHMLIMVVRFVTHNTKPPQTSELEVILVNSQTEKSPTKADVLAQVALDGGGNADQGRAKSPLPPSPELSDGDTLIRSQEKLAELEAAQKALAKQAQAAAQTSAKVDKDLRAKENKQKDAKVKEATVAPTQSASDQLPATPSPTPTLSAQDMLSSAKEIARLEAQVSRQIEDYNKRPRKHFFSPSTSPYEFAMYEDAWRQKVERFGNLNYPEEAKGKVYGQLRLTVYIRSDGSLEDIEVDKPSGRPVLDRAAIRIVRLAAPYAKFPPEMKKQVDILAVTRTWVFTNDSLETRGK
jgi:protein TonB